MDIETLLTILGSNVAVGVFSYFTGKRKTNAETDNVVLMNLEKSILLYKTIIDNLKQEITELHSKINELETKVDELHNENKQLKNSL